MARRQSEIPVCSTQGAADMAGALSAAVMAGEVARPAPARCDPDALLADIAARIAAADRG